MDLIMIFILGTCVGSFLNVLVDRLPRNESPIKGRSHCEKCKKELAWYDLIPLLSFILLKEKCRYCSTRLSWYYPITELTTGVVFLITTLFILSNSEFLIFNFKFLINDQIFNSQTLMTLIYYLFIVSSLVVVFFADLKYGIIPDKIIFPAIFVSAIYLFLNPFDFAQGLWPSSLIINHLFSAVGASLFFLILFLVTKGRGMGFGDVKFSFLMGLILGFPNIVIGLYAAFLTGAIVGCILIIWRKKKLVGTKIPFGPFLILGTFLAIFWGENLVKGLPWLNYYLRLQ